MKPQLKLNEPEVKHQSLPSKESAIDFSDLKQWKPLKVFAKDNQHFTLDQLRLLTRHRDSNGLSNICKKIGKTLYLHDSGFSLWISQQ